MTVKIIIEILNWKDTTELLMMADDEKQPVMGDYEPKEMGPGEMMMGGGDSDRSGPGEMMMGEGDSSDGLAFDYEQYKAD